MKLTLSLLLILFCIDVFAIPPLIPYRHGDKWGYANPEGAIVVQPVYTSVSHYGSETNYIVELNGKYGLLDATGKKVTDVIYERIMFTQNDEALITTRNGKMGIIDNKGKTLVPHTYLNIDYYPQDDKFILLTANKRATYTLKTKKIVVDAEEVNEESIGETVLAPEDDDDGEASIRYDLRYFVVASGAKSKIGKETEAITYQGGSPRKRVKTLDTLDFEFDKVILLNYYKVPAILVYAEGKWGVVHNDSVAVKAEYDAVSTVIINDVCKAFYFQVMKNGKWGIVDTKGNPMVPLQYDAIIHANRMSASGLSCYNVQDGIIVKSEGKFGLISIHHETLVPLMQDSIVYDDRKNYHVYFQGNRKGVYGRAFKTGLIFSSGEELADLHSDRGMTLMRVVDSRRTSQKEDSSGEPFFLGYVSSTGVRFYRN